jgi:hypothetical protein
LNSASATNALDAVKVLPNRTYVANVTTETYEEKKYYIFAMLYVDSLELMAKKIKFASFGTASKIIVHFPFYASQEYINQKYSVDSMVSNHKSNYSQQRPFAIKLSNQYLS